MPLFLFSCSCLVLTGFYAPRILAPWVIMRRLVRRENLFPRMATDGSPRCLLQLLGNAGRELTASWCKLQYKPRLWMHHHFGYWHCIANSTSIVALDVVLIHSIKTKIIPQSAASTALASADRRRQTQIDKNLVIKTNIASSPFAF